MSLRRGQAKLVFRSYIRGVIDCNEWKTEKRHECADMAKVKRLELWWQLYRTSLPVRDLENFKPMEFLFDRVYHYYRHKKHSDDLVINGLMLIVYYFMTLYLLHTSRSFEWLSAGWIREADPFICSHVLREEKWVMTLRNEWRQTADHNWRYLLVGKASWMEQRETGMKYSL
jgi:hypothetical protein